ncbi:hypothetical protein [Budvicia diplopodorum]|uniref:hypothetical protein n=1 Tax=Budvicia diplopodorum TaxID=1119056 RepID=UPI0013593C04|nr:hypothetical protein [Budvicia diplopodorum]
MRLKVIDSFSLHRVGLGLLLVTLGLACQPLQAAVTQGAGDLIINMEKKAPGRYSTTVTRDGGAGSLGASYFVTTLANGDRLSGVVQSAGQGVCSGRYLIGSGALQGVRIPIAMFSQRPYRYEKNYQCGSTINYAASSGDSVMGFAVGDSQSGDGTEIVLQKNADLSQYAGQRILLGNVRLTGNDGVVEASNVYLSFARTLRSDPALIDASFVNADAARFSTVAINQDTVKTAVLNVRRISDSPATVLPFSLTFESMKGAPNGDFRMYSLEQPDRFIPYGVSVDRRTVGYGDVLTYTLGSSSGSAQMLDITFTIWGKDLVGLKGGTRFSDTFTAVVTPGL